MKKCTCTHACIQRIIDTTVSLALLLPNPQVSERAVPVFGHSDACKTTPPPIPQPQLLFFSFLLSTHAVQGTGALPFSERERERERDRKVGWGVSERERELELESFILQGLQFRFSQNLTTSPF